jgi:hypothetical protein
LLFSVWFAVHYAPEKFIPTIVFLNVFFLIYALVPFAYYFVRGHAGPRPGLAIIILNAATAFGYSYRIISRFASTESVGITTFAYALVFFAMAGFLLRRNRVSRQAIVLLTALGLLFLVLTVPICFSGNWVTVFWTILAVAMLWASVRLVDVRLLYFGVVVLLVTTFKLGVFDLMFLFDFDAWTMRFTSGFGSAIVERWTTCLTVLSGVFAGALLTGTVRGKLVAASDVRGLLWGIFGGLLFGVLNIEVAAWFYDYARPARFAAVSVLWGLFAASLMGVGFARNLSMARGLALGLFAGTLVKVFFHDMAHVSTPYRIISFLVVGSLLIGVSFLYHRFKGRLLPPSAASDGTTS